MDNLDITYSDFVTRLDCVINTITPCKTVRVKNNASEERDAAQNLIRKNKKAYSEEKLKGKQLGLPQKKSPCTDICLKAIE